MLSKLCQTQSSSLAEERSQSGPQTWMPPAETSASGSHIHGLMLLVSSLRPDDMTWEFEGEEAFHIMPSQCCTTLEKLCSP